jgi:hypothetical protein
MKYLAILIVALAFIWYYASQPKTQPEPVLVHAPPRPGELSAVEKDYYVKVFEYVMDTITTKEPYPWKSSDNNIGAISVGETFTSKSKAICRPYSETFDVGGYKGTNEGIACKRVGNEGWCRLKKTDALTCALETPAMIAGYPFPGLRYEMPSLPTTGGSAESQQGGGVGKVGPSSTQNAPASPFDGESGNKSNKPGQGYADTVTGTAGGAAGPATGGALNWFNETFR